MNFSVSTFVVEANGKPYVAFQTKRYGDADLIGRGWAEEHSDQLPTRGRYNTDLPPIIKVRIAKPREKAAYEDETNASEFYADVKIVYLPDEPNLPDEPS
jgi:hypothetical protein